MSCTLLRDAPPNITALWGEIMLPVHINECSLEDFSIDLQVQQWTRKLPLTLFSCTEYGLHTGYSVQIHLPRPAAMACGSLAHRRPKKYLDLQKSYIDPLESAPSPSTFACRGITPNALPPSGHGEPPWTASLL